jgi:hypothetical protein
MMFFSLIVRQFSLRLHLYRTGNDSQLRFNSIADVKVSRMVIVEISEGLGNQMFQYATGRALAIRQHSQLLLNLRWYKLTNYRSYGLCNFKIQTQEADYLTLFPYLRKSQTVLRAITGQNSKNWVTPSSNRFDPSVLNRQGTTYLTGLFQSELYFQNCSDEIRREFQLKDDLPASLKDIQSQMGQTNSVSLHVRRGDYTGVTLNNYALPTEYYLSAMRLVESRIKNPTFFVFSDDPEWVRSNLAIGRSVVVSGVGARDYEEMHLMSSCQNHVIANSTFSWWGAWLNPKSDKVVVAPKQWFRQGSDLDTTDIVPKSWILL